MARKKEITVTPEWPHPVDISNLDGRTMSVHIEADPSARAALAIRLGVLRVEKAEADLNIKREPGGAIIHVEGHLKAQVVQNCVVTLQPLTIPVEEDFEGWFTDPEEAVSFVKARHEKIQRAGQVEMPILEERDDPEEIVDGAIDVGELTTQYLSLAIDPYPHAEGVQYEVGDDGPRPEPAEERKNPFAALKDWKSSHNKDKG